MTLCSGVAQHKTENASEEGDTNDEGTANDKTDDLTGVVGSRTDILIFVVARGSISDTGVFKARGKNQKATKIGTKMRNPTSIPLE